MTSFIIPSLERSRIPFPKNNFGVDDIIFAKVEYVICDLEGIRG